MKGAFSDPRAKGLDLPIPGPRVHVLRPERPCSALSRTRLINAAALPFQESARPFKLIEMKITLSFRAMSAREAQG